MSQISIIVPVYNVETYIKECIDSILHQSYQDFEIILVDDGSTDGSLEILEEYKTAHPDCIQIITQQNQGASVARNTGLEQSRGPYIMFVDSDDFLEEEMLELMYHSAIENESDLVLCDARVVKEEDGSFIKIWNSGVLNKKEESIYTNKSLINTILPAPWGKLYKKSLFIDNDITFPLGLRNQDLGTTPRVLCHCQKISKVNRALYNYRYRKESAMRTYDYKILDASKNLQIVKRYYTSMHIEEKFKDELEYLFIEHLLFRAIYRVKNVEDVSVREELMGNICDTLNKEFPQWHHNKNIHALPRNKRAYLYLVKRGHIGRVMAMFRLKKRVLRS